MKKTKTQKGITLIALIITIVILLILAVVTINAIQGDGIIRYASNAADDYTAKANEEQENLNTLLGQIEGSLSKEEKITWTKTSEGDLAVESTVVTNTGENFYVIGFKDNNETVVLLAKNNLNADGSAQDPEGAINPCAFSELENLSFTPDVDIGENLNNNSTLKEDTTSAVYKAMKYGESLGISTGRLLNDGELGSVSDDILYGIDGKSSGDGLSFWLGTSDYSSNKNVLYAWYEELAIASEEYTRYDSFGVRPVVEISKSSIL